jgi:hypothetical protein
MVTPRSVESPHYHIWTDALHGRHLAREASNDWDRGTYVRWTISSAWTAFELACEDATGAQGLGYRFKDKLDGALSAKGIALNWGQGLWQQVLLIHRLRIDYVHPGVPQDRLFAPVQEADKAISVLREAIRDLCSRVGTPVPEWIDDDDNPVAPKGGTAHATLIHAGVREDDPGTIRITYVYKGEEYESDLLPPGTDPSSLLHDLIRRILVPISAVRAYRRDTLIEEIPVRMRGS